VAKALGYEYAVFLERGRQLLKPGLGAGEGQDTNWLEPLLPLLAGLDRSGRDLVSNFILFVVNRR
jgi:hypothetical protein